VVPQSWKVVQAVRERFSCRVCETIIQPRTPFCAIARGPAGPNLLAMVLEAKYGPTPQSFRQRSARASPTSVMPLEWSKSSSGTELEGITINWFDLEVRANLDQIEF
jgi:hypothetical protein